MPGSVPVCVLIHLTVKIKWASPNSFAIFQMKKQIQSESSSGKEENYDVNPSWPDSQGRILSIK